MAAAIETSEAPRSATFQIEKYVAPVFVFSIFIVVWQLVCGVFHVPSFLVPSPYQIVESFIQHASVIWQATWVTFEAAFGGFVLSAVIGISIAFLMSQAKWIERSFYPFAVLMQTIPIVAIAPLVVLWVGSNIWSIIVIAFMIAVFPIISNANFGFLSAEKNLINLVTMYSRSRWTLFLKVRFPNGLPQICSGLKISAGMSVIGAIVGQFVNGVAGGNGGLGYLITAAAQQLQMAYLFAAALSSALLGLFMFGLVNVITYFCIGKWHESEIKAE